MKRFVFLLIACLSLTCGFAQLSTKENAKESIRSTTDFLTEEEKDTLFILAEEVMLISIDSVINEGRYMQALDLIDSLKVNWKYLTGREPSPRLYLKKESILMNLEEWRELIETTEECFSIHKLDIPNNMAAIMCSMQGLAHRNLNEYQEAIRSFEEGTHYYNMIGDINNQGDMLCSIAYCYEKLGKHILASSFYQKGIDKFLSYFKTTKSSLLRNDLHENDSYKQTVLDLFGTHLYNIAVYEQNYGSRLNSKDYLLMSAHCGNTLAKSEYQRIYGNR